MAVVVGGRASDQRPHRAPVGLGVAGPLQQQDPAALGPHDPLGAGVERPAPPARSQRQHLLGHPGRGLGQDHVDPADQRVVAVVRPQRPAGQVDRDQRRRARRVDREARSPQIEQVGQSVRGDAVRTARSCVRGDLGLPGQLQVQVVGAVKAQEDAGRTLAQPLGGQPGVLDGLPCRLQYQPLLGVQVGGFGRGHAKELGVEPVDRRQHPAPPAAPGPGLRPGAGIRRRTMPVDVVDQRRYRVLARRQQAPQAVEVTGPTRGAHTGANHRDRLMPGVLSLPQPLPDVAELPQRPDEQRGLVAVLLHRHLSPSRSNASSSRSSR